MTDEEKLKRGEAMSQTHTLAMMAISMRRQQYRYNFMEASREVDRWRGELALLDLMEEDLKEKIERDLANPDPKETQE